MRSRIVAAGASIILASIAAACGGGASTEDVVVDETITIEAKNVKFVPSSITVPVGKTVKLLLKNGDKGTEHDLTSDDMVVAMVEGGGHGAAHGSTSGGGDSTMLVVHAKDGETSSAIFKAHRTGTYNIYCTIAGHKDAGMIGTITVI